MDRGITLGVRRKKAGVLGETLPKTCSGRCSTFQVDVKLADVPFGESPLYLFHGILVFGKSRGTLDSPGLGNLWPRLGESSGKHT